MDPECGHHWIAANGVCVCGYKPPELGDGGSKHNHRFLYGGNVCSDCGATIINPILTSDDPRCGRQEPDWSHEGRWFGPVGENPPLPLLLVELWDEGLAPPAPFVEDVSSVEKPRDRHEWLQVFTQWDRGQPIVTQIEGGQIGHA